MIKSLFLNKQIAVFFLCLGLIKTQAQITFKVKIPWAILGYDMIEDSKGCYAVIYNKSLHRLDAFGNEMWSFKGDDGFMQILDIKDSSYYIVSGIAEYNGGLYFNAISYSGKLIWKKWLPYYLNNNVILTNWYDIVLETQRNEIVLAGKHERFGSTKIQYWMGGVDFRGNIKWQKIWTDQGKNRWIRNIYKNHKTGGYVMITEDECYCFNQLIYTDSNGKELKRTAPDISVPADQQELLNVYSAQEISDSTFIMQLLFKSDSYGLILDKDGNKIKTVPFYTLQNVKNQQNKLVNYSDYLFILNDNNGIQKKEVIISDDIDNTSSNFGTLRISKDNGFYGIIQQTERVTADNWMYIFKTDSNGNIYNKEPKKRKEDVVWMQPNPARDIISFSVPYYHYNGLLQIEITDLNGKQILTTKIYDNGTINIKHLQSGMYIVKAKNIDTNKTTVLKLIKN